MKFWREIAIGVSIAGLISLATMVKNLSEDAIANEYKFVNIHNELMSLSTSLEVIHNKLDKSEFYNYKENNEKVNALNIELLQKEIEHIDKEGK